MLIYDLKRNFQDVNINFDIEKSNYWIIATVEEVKSLKQQLSIDDECISKCNNIKQYSSISFFEKYSFLVLNMLSYESKVIISNELSVFLGEKYILTVYKEKKDILELIINDIYKSKNSTMLKNNPKPSIVLYYILDRIIVRNYDVISRLETVADKIEINILKNPRHEQIDELINLRRQVFNIRKFLNPLRYIGDTLITNENLIIQEENIKHFINLNNKINKLMNALEILIQDLALVREAFESEIANKTNELMKIFTLIATIFLPLNLLTSLNGMNYDNIPFCTYKYGYYIMIIIIIAISIFLVLLFKRKKWL